MSQNRYYSKLSILVFFLTAVLFGRILIPESNDKYSEFLNKNDVGREYHELTNKGLVYNVKGPAEIKIFSKAAFPKKTPSEGKYFSYNISVNNLSAKSDNFKNIDRKTTSISHPMHVYTYSAKDIIVVPSGDYKIKINKDSILGPPILVRISRIGRKSKKNIKEEFNISGNFPTYTLSSIQSTFRPSYYSLNYSKPLFLNNIEGLFEFNLRGLHDGLTDDPKIIQATLLKNGKRNARYHILSIPHPSKTINENNKIPGKLNKIYVESNQDNYLFHIEDEESDLLIKMNRFIK